MQQTIIAEFDGETLRPVHPVDLRPQTRYRVTVDDVLVASNEPLPDAVLPDNADAWDWLDHLRGTVDASPDWSAEHDHYLYGTPKQRS